MKNKLARGSFKAILILAEKRQRKVANEPNPYNHIFTNYKEGNKSGNVAGGFFLFTFNFYLFKYFECIYKV